MKKIKERQAWNGTNHNVVRCCKCELETVEESIIMRTIRNSLGDSVDVEDVCPKCSAVDSFEEVEQ